MFTDASSTDPSTTSSENLITFHHPQFDKSISGKIHNKIDMSSSSSTTSSTRKKQQQFLTLQEPGLFKSAISTEGFSAHVDGIHIFATTHHYYYCYHAKNTNNSDEKRDDKNNNICIGFTSDSTYPTSVSYCIPGNGMPGTCLQSATGERSTGTKLVSYITNILPTARAKEEEDHQQTQQQTEIIAILKISSIHPKRLDMKKIQIQWIVDGHKGPIVDCSDDFLTTMTNNTSYKIYPCISLCTNLQKVQTVPLERGWTTKSPEINRYIFEVLMRTPLSRNLINYFETHAPYNLSHIFSVLEYLRSDEDRVVEYFRRLKVIYGFDVDGPANDDDDDFLLL